MLYRALVSFSGLVSMTMGEVKEIKNEQIAKDLLRARYIEEVKDSPKVKASTKPKIEPQTEEKQEPKEEVKETKKKTTRRKTPKKEG